MKRRHEVICEAGKLPAWKVGIWQVFDPWTDPHLQVLQGHNVPTFSRPAQIEFHFRRVVRRLVLSLSRLSRQICEWECFLKAGALASDNPGLAFDIPEEGGMAADSVFFYLNIFLDDVARVIPFVLAEDESSVVEPDGFGELRQMVNDGRLITQPEFKSLFEELSDEHSWWSKGFKRGVGIRQRLTHYTDIVYFSGSTKLDDQVMTGNISFGGIGGPVHTSDFELEMQVMFRNLCEWLERLDQQLMQRQTAKLVPKGIVCDPTPNKCPAIDLPNNEDVRKSACHHLYLPIFRDA